MFISLSEGLGGFFVLYQLLISSIASKKITEVCLLPRGFSCVYSYNA